MTTFYLPLIFILMLYWRIYQAARKRINKRKTEASSVKKHKKSSDSPKKSAAKFRFKNRNRIPTDDWDSSQNSEAVRTTGNVVLMSLIIIDFQKASMRSSTKSESNGNNSDNMNNNTIDVDEEKRTADDVIDVATECNSKLLNQPGSSESELTQRAEHAAENDQSAKVNVYEQVRLLSVINYLSDLLFTARSAKRNHRNGKRSSSSTSSHNHHFSFSVLLDAIFLIGSFLHYFSLGSGHP